MRDIVLESTFRHAFTTRGFADGVPATLSGSPVLSVLEENNATPITAGVSVSVDRASVVGLNEATIVATAANGYESGKSYAIYISTGTVGGTSVVGEVVGHFTIAASAAAVDLANGTDGLGAIKAETAAILVDTGTTLQAEVDAIQAAVITNAAGVDIAADIIALKAETAAILADTGTDGVVVAAASKTGYTLSAAGLADFFDTDSGTTFAAAVAGSVVKEIADNAGGSALTEAGIADAVWNELQADHVGAGSFGEVATEVAAILVDTAEIGAAGAGLTAINLPDQTMSITGNITGNLSGSVGSVTGAVASVTGLTAADVGAIKTQTDKLTFTVANQVDANTQYINDTAVTGDGSATPWGPA